MYRLLIMRRIEGYLEKKIRNLSIEKLRMLGVERKGFEPS